MMWPSAIRPLSIAKAMQNPRPIAVVVTAPGGGAVIQSGRHLISLQKVG